ncbi:CotS family spore coat protein [Heliorestis convoluta]|uniref:Spore coat, CotS family protein n=1 Tax=Heliorestis convoluta TaxID=356322 RepID=A0A5Q2N5V8_9FIRM|nr:CotS family spore coat protein [Heliorestis convoluta]QGG49269.1 spore coat, CotS family protein [Heliorestis convoluta]
MIENDQNFVSLGQEEQEVLQQYPYEIGRTERRGRGWRLETDRGSKGLYRYKSLDRDRIFAVHHALEQLAARGFRHTSRHIRTRQGEPFVRKGSSYYILVDWYSYPSVDFCQDRDLQVATRNLALLHRLGHVKERQEEVDRVMNRQALEDRNRELQEYRQRVEKRGRYNAFDEIFLENARKMEQKSTEAIERLIASDIDKLYTESSEKGSICHRHWTEKNLRLSKDNNLAIIGWDNCGTDLPVAELTRFIRHVMDRRESWDIDTGKEMLAIYEEIRPLDKRETDVLASLLSFPHKFWKVVASYYRDGHRSEELLSSFRQAIEEEVERDSFLEKLRQQQRA